MPKLIALATALFLISTIPAAGLYGFKLHRIYWQSTAVLGVPDVDYSYMAIATKPITESFRFFERLFCVSQACMA